MMGKRSKSMPKSTTHQLFKTKDKNRVDDLQGMFTDLQHVKKQSRVDDALVLEEQVHKIATGMQS